jgi:hypothetical protein
MERKRFKELRSFNFFRPRNLMVNVHTSELEKTTKRLQKDEDVRVSILHCG